MIHRIGVMVVSLNTSLCIDIMSSSATGNGIFNPFTMMEEPPEVIPESEDDMNTKKVETKNTTICPKGVTVSFSGGYFRRIVRRVSGFWTQRAHL